MTPESPPTNDTLLTMGGWSLRYARVDARAEDDRALFVVVDTNGDGRQWAALLLRRNDGGSWDFCQEDSDSMESGEWDTPWAFCAWGRAAKRAHVEINHLGVKYSTRADRTGRWAFVHGRDEPDFGVWS
jgi:hypothetical protein